MKIGVVIPSYCEAENIVKLLKSVNALPLPMEKIVVVDDTPDRTVVEAIESQKWGHVHCIHREGKKGRGSAIWLGFQYLLEYDLDFCIEMDADFSHNPSEIPKMLDVAVKKGADLVIASRYLKRSEIFNWPMGRRVFSTISNFIAQGFLRVPVSDYTNGFRVYSSRAMTELVRNFTPRELGFIVLSEILVHLFYRGFKVEEVPTRFVNRVRGRSSLSLREVKGSVMGLLKLCRRVPSRKKTYFSGLK